MSLNAAAIALMRDKGLTLDDVVEIATAMETRRDPTAADRMARHRAKKATKVTRNVTPNTPLNDNISKPPEPSLQNPTDSSEKEAAEPQPALRQDHVIEAWNDVAERVGLVKVKRLTPQRQRQLAARLKQNSVEDFTEAIQAIERSPFLRGENDRGWRADFDFLLQPKSFTKLIEGSYG